MYLLLDGRLSVGSALYAVATRRDLMCRVSGTVGIAIAATVCEVFVYCFGYLWTAGQRGTNGRALR